MKPVKENEIIFGSFWGWGSEGGGANVTHPIFTYREEK